MFRFTSFLLIALLSVVSISGQEPQKDPSQTGSKKDESAIPKQISGGVLNGKALSLPKPPYPPAARAVGASGPVSVQVLIDVNGDVLSATAVSGHPLLRAVAVEAAQQAKFSPTQLQGNPVKVSGIITYNFVGPLYPAKIGYILAFAERSGKFESGTNPKSLAAQLPPDWTQEREVLNGLTFEKPATPVVSKMVPPPNAARPTPNDTNRYTVIGSSGAANIGGESLDSRSISALRDLQPLFATRLEPNAAATFGFELGLALGELVAGTKDDGVPPPGTLEKIEALALRAPTSVNPTALQRVRDFITAARNPDVVFDIRGHAQILSNYRY